MVKKNRSSQYLFSFFVDESNQFKTVFNKFSKSSLYINDHGYIKEHGVSYSNHIFTLVDIVKTENFDKYLSFIRQEELYEDDYEISSRYHMIVLKVPEKFKLSLLHFRHSAYSKMFDVEHIERCFKNSKSYVAKYKEVILTFDACNDLTSNPDLQTDEIGKNLQLSPYYVLNKHKDLKEMLKILYQCKIDDNTELDSLLNLEEEVFRFDSTMMKEKEKLDESVTS
jgi:hypothetical protein